jgi:hypothetical protein
MVECPEGQSLEVEEVGWQDNRKLPLIVDLDRETLPMSAVVLVAEDSPSTSGARFFFGMLAVIVAAGLLAGLAPIGFSIVTVFLFAGPHNWMEARYIMTRMPPRWGKLTGYFSLGIFGVLVLGASLAVLPFLLRHWQASADVERLAFALWGTLFLAWLLTLAELRSRQNPRRDWAWLTPVGLLAMAGVWLFPFQSWLVLVYAHPLVALWFLDRELGQRRADWQRMYRWGLMLVPAVVAIFWWQLAAASTVASGDGLSEQIAAHAGSQILTGVSSHFLVATHVFLEMLHYGVWLVAIPLVALADRPWSLDRVPLAKRSMLWRRGLQVFLAVGLLICCVIWLGFAIDYPLTRQIYFAVAVLHVLAEIPFLLRLL